jgi:hypothetical protein
MMVHGLYRDLRIVVFNFGIREVRLCNACCRAIKIQVSFSILFCFGEMLTFFLLQVISIDLSPAGSILATGSGDWQARICTSGISHLFYFEE